MSWFNRHIDAWLEPWAQGELPSGRASRLLRHAHTCERCGRLYEQWARAHRMLEGGDMGVPSSAEGSALMASGLEAALAAAAPAPGRMRWPVMTALLGTVAAACVALLVVGVPGLSGTPEWQPRGLGMAAPGAVLRLFCATPGQALRELGSEDTCPPGALLAFAAGAQSPLSHVAVRVHAPGWRQEGSPFPVGGKPGQEVPLEWTLRLPPTAGAVVEVEAAFAPGSEAALRALHGQQGEGKVVLRRQSVRLQEDP